MIQPHASAHASAHSSAHIHAVPARRATLVSVAVVCGCFGMVNFGSAAQPPAPAQSDAKVAAPALSQSKRVIKPQPKIKSPVTAKTKAKVQSRPPADNAPIDKALSVAQDRAVANYRRYQSRKAAAAKLAQTRAAAAKAMAAKKAQADARALAKAQDRVVAHYKGIPLVATRRVEVLTCFAGIQDKHARIGVQLVNGQVNNFSFYSKSKPRTCSIDVKRDGPYSHWEDNGVVSRVTLMEEKGVLLIDHKRGSYRFVFQSVDRMRYCGMEGKINGSLIVMRGKSKCDVHGIMDGHQG